MQNIWQKRLYSSASVQEPLTRIDRTVGRQLSAITSCSSHLGPVVAWVLLGVVLLLTETMTSYIVVRITQLGQTYGSLLSRPY